MLTEEIMQFRLKKLRTEANYSQKKLGEFLDVTQTTINAWEKGRQQPSWQKIYLLTKLYNVNSDYLYGIDPDTKGCLKKIKNKDSLLGENSPLAEDHKIIVGDKFAEIEDYKKKYIQTQDENYLHFMLIADDTIDDIILRYKIFANEIFSISPKRGVIEIIGETNQGWTSTETHAVKDFKDKNVINISQYTDKQLEVIESIKDLTDEDCRYLLASISAIKIANQEKENTIKKFKD